MESALVEAIGGGKNAIKIEQEFSSLRCIRRQRLTRCLEWQIFHFGHRPFLSLPFIYFLFFFVVLGPHPRHMEVPRLGVESELPLPAYTTGHSNAGSLTH